MKTFTGESTFRNIDKIADFGDKEHSFSAPYGRIAKLTSSHYGGDQCGSGVSPVL